jgi:hypothetical protein
LEFSLLAGRGHFVHMVYNNNTCCLNEVRFLSNLFTSI